MYSFIFNINIDVYVIITRGPILVFFGPRIMWSKDYAVLRHGCSCNARFSSFFSFCFIYCHEHVTRKIGLNKNRSVFERSQIKQARVFTFSDYVRVWVCLFFSFPHRLCRCCEFLILFFPLKVTGVDERHNHGWSGLMVV